MYAHALSTHSIRIQRFFLTFLTTSRHADGENAAISGIENLSGSYVQNLSQIFSRAGDDEGSKIRISAIENYSIYFPTNRW